MKKLIDAYLLYAKTNEQAYQWAYDEVNALIAKPAGLSVVFELVQACESDSQIAYVAAGPLEDLITKHLDVIESELTTMVRTNDKMRKAICGVFASEGSAARKIVDNILHKFGLTYGSL